MARTLDDAALDQLFRAARTHVAWSDRPVEEELLRRLYDLLKWGPTSANLSPARFLFLRTKESRERLRPALAPGNVEKTMSAPVTVVIAHDERFYEEASRLFPHHPGIRDLFASTPALAESTAFRNGTLQGAYLIMAARSLGLDCGPMSGFDNAKVDAEFFSEAECAKHHVTEVPRTARLKSNFLCNLGYGDPLRLHPRGPRLEFDEACRML